MASNAQVIKQETSSKANKQQDDVAKQGRAMFDKGLVKPAFQFFELKIEDLVKQVSDTEQEGCRANCHLELIKLRLIYAKLLIKAGLLLDARVQLDVNVLSKVDLPVLLKAKALYISGKLCFFENSYTRSLTNYESAVEILSSNRQ